MNRDEEKINETKRWFFEKINKSDKPLVEIPGGGKKKRESTKINKISNEKENTTQNHRNTKDHKRSKY